MIILIIILAIISAFFSSLLVTQDLLYKNIIPDFKKSLIPIVAGIIIFILFYNYRNALVLQMIFGVFVLIYAMLYLDVIAIKGNLNHFFIHLILITVLSAVNKIAWPLILSGPLIFIIIYGIAVYLSQKLFSTNTENKEYIHFLELARILNSIYLIIFGLIFASDRMSFLERLSKILF